MPSKYKEEDYVRYKDRDGSEREGVVIEVFKTDVYSWNRNKERENLYMLSNSSYLRSEEEILGYVK